MTESWLLLVIVLYSELAFASIGVFLVTFVAFQWILNVFYYLMVDINVAELGGKSPWRRAQKSNRE